MAAVIAALVVTAVYPSLPAGLPARVAGATASTDAGPRWIIWILLAVWFAVQLLVAVLSTRPHLLNYPSAVTDANAQELYVRGEQFLVAMGIAVACMFAGIVLVVLGVGAVPLVVAGFAALFVILIAGTARLASVA